MNCHDHKVLFAILTALVAWYLRNLSHQFNTIFEIMAKYFIISPRFFQILYFLPNLMMALSPFEGLETGSVDEASLNCLILRQTLLVSLRSNSKEQKSGKQKNHKNGDMPLSQVILYGPMQFIWQIKPGDPGNSWLKGFWNWSTYG